MINNNEDDKKDLNIKKGEEENVEEINLDEFNMEDLDLPQGGCNCAGCPMNCNEDVEVDKEDEDKK